MFGTLATAFICTVLSLLYVCMSVQLGAVLVEHSHQSLGSVVQMWVSCCC